MLSVVVEKGMTLGYTVGWLDIADFTELQTVGMNDILEIQCKDVEKQ